MYVTMYFQSLKSSNDMERDFRGSLQVWKNQSNIKKQTF